MVVPVQYIDILLQKFHVFLSFHKNISKDLEVAPPLNLKESALVNLAI